MKAISRFAILCSLLQLAAQPLSAQPLFTDVTTDIGHDLFVAGSIALQDHDNDGWADLYMAIEANEGSNQIALLRNSTDGSFADRAAQSADVEKMKWKGEGNAWADYDNDGDLDLFQPRGQVRNYEPDLLLRNDQGTFSDVSAAAGFNTALPSNIAVWLDYDRDGHVDLYVGHFIIGADPNLTNALYRNQGDGTFVDVTAAARLAVPLHPEGLPFAGGSPLGMAAADFDNDGWPDLYITAIFAPNRLFINQRDGTFAEAPQGDLNDPGEAFGMAVGDIDNNGTLDIFQPSGVGEQRFRSPLLLNRGGGVFLDITESAGLESLTDQNTRGGVFIEADNDGDLDLLIPFPLSFFLNNGDGNFSEATATSGLVSVGAQTSIADYDNDGFLDFATGGNTNNAIPTSLYRNLGNANHYLRIALVGVTSNRSAIGARLVATAGELMQTRQILGSLGTSQYELTAHFGLGTHSQVDQLEIHWPNGLIDVFTAIPADQEIRIIEGRDAWHPLVRSVWTEEPPSQLTFDREATIRATVRPALFETTATITAVTADLSGLGGPAAISLTDLGDGTYRLDHTFTVGGNDAQRDIEVLVLQQSSLGEHWTRLSHTVAIAGDPNTAVLEDFSAGAPDDFALAQNYPNPFNSGTVIRFDLPQSNEIELAIYNIAGQKVATLVKGMRQAGNYAINWDGKDELGTTLATGVYLYELRVGERIENRKLTLLR